MNSNLYQAPQAELTSSNVNSEIPSAIDIEKLRRVAKGRNQLLLLFWIEILTIIIVAICAFSFDAGSSVTVGLIIFSIQCLGSMFITYPLAKELYNKPFAYLLGFITVMPQSNWIILLIINGRAVRYLQDNNIKVNFLGSDLRHLN